MNVGVEDLGDLAAGEGNGFLKVVLEGENAQRDENIEILLGGQAEFVVALNLPDHAHFGAIGQQLGAVELQLADGLPDSAFQHGERNRSEILLFNREVEQRRFALWFFQNRYQLNCFYTCRTPRKLHIYDEAHGFG